MSALTSPAHAATKSTSDYYTNDVQRFNEDGVSTKGPKALEKAADIVSMTATNSTKVTLRIEVADLTKGLDTEAYARLKTNNGTAFTVSAVSGPDGLELGLSSDADGELGCGSLTVSSNAGKDVFVMKLSRKCLGSPKWFTFGGGVAIFDDSGVYVDDAIRKANAPGGPEGFKIGTKKVTYN